MVNGHSFETDPQGNLVGVPTNLKVDRAGNVFDGAGNYVGRAGEVYVDADGNAVNAAGQIVGFATAGTRAPVSNPVVPNVPVAATPAGATYQTPPSGNTRPVVVGAAVPDVEPEPVVRTYEESVSYAQPAVGTYDQPTMPASESEIVGGVSNQPSAPVRTLAHEAAEVLSKGEFYRDANGGLLQVPTNLKVGADGMVRDARGHVVGRAGEVFVDAHGNAVNADGHVVGVATAPLSPIIEAAHQSTYQHSTYQQGIPAQHPYSENYNVITNNDVLVNRDYSGRTYTDGEIMPDNYNDEGAVYNDGTEFAGEPFIENATEGLVPEQVVTEQVVTEQVVPEQVLVGDAAADAGVEYIDGVPAYNYRDAGYDTGARAWPDPRNKYMDGPDGVEQNRYGDGVYGDGSTFASRAFGQNLDTEMLDRDTPDRPLELFGHNDLGAAGEPVGYEEGAPARENRWQHRAMHRVTGESVATDLTVDADGNVHDAAGNYVGKAGEVVAEPDGTVLNAVRQVVGRAVGEIFHNN